jgi:hypothetical protein
MYTKRIPYELEVTLMKLTGQKSERNNVVTEVELSTEDAKAIEDWTNVTLIGKDKKPVEITPGRFCALILAPNGNGSYRLSPERGARMYASFCTKSEEEKAAVLEAAKKSPEKYRTMFLSELYNGKIKIAVNDLLTAANGRIQIEGQTFVPERGSKKIVDPLAAMFC